MSEREGVIFRMNHSQLCVSGSPTGSPLGRGKTDREISHSEQFGVDRVCAPQVPGGEAGVGSEPGVPLLLETPSGCQRMGSAVRRGRDHSCLCAHVPWASWGGCRLGGVPQGCQLRKCRSDGLAYPPRTGPTETSLGSEALALPVFPTPHASLQPQGVQVGCQGRRRSPGSSPAWLAFCRGREDI